MYTGWERGVPRWYIPLLHIEWPLGEYCPVLPYPPWDHLYIPGTYPACRRTPLHRLAAR